MTTAEAVNSTKLCADNALIKRVRLADGPGGGAAVAISCRQGIDAFYLAYTGAKRARGSQIKDFEIRIINQDLGVSHPPTH